MSELATMLAPDITHVQTKIAVAAQHAGRQPEEITLVAVTKTHPLSIIKAAYEAGLRNFGENRVDETRQKIKAMAAQPLPQKPVWHFIGHVQRRQVDGILEGDISLLHSLDSLKLARRFQRLATRDEYPPLAVLLQCNVSGEESKYGFNLQSWSSNPKQLAQFLSTVEQIAKLDKLKISGLMTMAPYSDEPENSRPVFQSLVRLQQRLQTEFPHLNWSQLSMGMTNDFEVAIEEGATIVRVGRALFGERSVN